jgi:DeoR family transcriptional regulator of aga operon/DeoR family fructose operon transcriptional repressor
VVAIVDHTKWGKAAFATFCQLESITGVISDGAAPLELVDALRARRIDVQLVGSGRPDAAGAEVSR